MSAKNDVLEKKHRSRHAGSRQENNKRVSRLKSTTSSWLTVLIGQTIRVSGVVVEGRPYGEEQEEEEKGGPVDLHVSSQCIL